MLVIDVAGILGFLFWVVVVCAVLGLIGFIIGGASDKVEEWKKEGPVYAVIMIFVSIAVVAVYLLLLKNKIQG